MHDTYRRLFNAVDLFNRDCFGSHSLQFTVHTKSWQRRLFLALFEMCKTNALHAYRYLEGPITRYDWWVKLADKLVNNPFYTQGEDKEVESSDAESSDGENTGACGDQWYTTGTAGCKGCGRPVHWQCKCTQRCCRAGWRPTEV